MNIVIIMRLICCLAIASLLLAGCHSERRIAVCGSRGVKSMHVDNYGGNGKGREIIVCNNGDVYEANS